MVLPHHRDFAFRPHIFWGAVLLSLVLAVRVRGATVGQLAAFTAGAGVAAGALYLYVRWLIRLDGAFRHVHPRKIFVTSLVSFYTPVVVGVTMLLAAPWFFDRLDSPQEGLAYFLSIPCLLAAAAGAYRGFEEARRAPGPGWC